MSLNDVEKMDARRFLWSFCTGFQALWPSTKYPQWVESIFDVIQWYFVTKTVRKNCSSDREIFLRSLEQFIQTVKGQNNFW